MEDFQKEFLHIKSLINQKNTLFLNNEQFLTINISEDLRDKIKRFWNGLDVQDQVALFLDDNGRGSKMVTEALRSFGSAFFSAKTNPKGLSSIDKAISEKTYFSTEELPGFEGRLAMTQLFCNGRNSNGAYRMHNFFYLLPADDFERESQEAGELRIGDCLQNLDSDSGSKDAMYCLKLLKEAYGEVQLKYFKMGIFLGDYLPDNLWSAWRYMNCREFTLGEATMIPITMYDTFIDNANDYFKRFIQKLQPSLLTELWKTNISIAIFSTLFENNLVLGFFMNNQKLASRYQFTPNCRQANKARDKRYQSTQESDSIRSGSGTDSSNLKEAPPPRHKLSSRRVQPEANDGSSDYTGSNGSSNGSYHSLSSNSLSNHSNQLSKSTGGGEGISLKKQPQRSSASKPQFDSSRKQSGHHQAQNEWPGPQPGPQPAPPSFPPGVFAPCLRMLSSPGLQPACFPLSGQDASRGQPGEDQLVVLIDPNPSTSYDAVPATSRVKRFFMRRNLVQFHDHQDKSFAFSGSDLRIIEAFELLRKESAASRGASLLAPLPIPGNQLTGSAAQHHSSDRRNSQLSHGQKSLHENLHSPLEARDWPALRGNPTAASGSHRTVDAQVASATSQQGQLNAASANSCSKKKHFRAAGMISNAPLVDEFHGAEDSRKEGPSPHHSFAWLLKKRIIASVPPGFELPLHLPATKIELDSVPPRFSKLKL